MKDLFAPEGQGAGNKKQTQEIGDEGEEEEIFAGGGGWGGDEGWDTTTKDCLWMEKRQTWHIGK